MEVMSTTDKPINMVDVAAAVIEEGEGTEVLGVLSAVMNCMQADRDHWAGIQDSWLAQAKAEARAMKDGVYWALSQSESGGTTRQYERTLEAIEDAIADARFGPISDWYVKQYTEHGPFGDFPCHPKYRTLGDY